MSDCRVNQGSLTDVELQALSVGLPLHTFTIRNVVYLSYGTLLLDGLIGCKLVALVENLDFIPVDKLVEWHEDSDLTQCVHIPIINDECLEEKEETFNVSLSTEEECVEFTVDCTTVTIQDDDRELQPHVARNSPLRERV